MTNVTDDGKIKKKVLREGVGLTPPCNSMVSIKYSSYLEYNDEPTDYIYMKKPYNFRLGNAMVYGLNIAVQSMKINEKAIFLIHPDYAFGEMGHPPRIPAKATFLFQIELLRFVDSGDAVKFDDLTADEKKQFPVAYKTALSLVEHAKDFFKLNTKRSIREYNRAASLLQYCHLGDMEDQKQQQKLLFKLYTNLAVCYTKENIPRKACSMCNQIYAMCKNTSIQIPAKVYFHNGRALSMLGDYEAARAKLLTAQRLEPHNVDISTELAKNNATMKEKNKIDRRLAQALVNKQIKPEDNNKSTKKGVITASSVDDSFEKEIQNLCKNLLQNQDQLQFKLPGGLTEKECESAKNEAEKVGLYFRESVNKDKKTFYITK